MYIHKYVCVYAYTFIFIWLIFIVFEIYMQVVVGEFSFNFLSIWNKFAKYSSSKRNWNVFYILYALSAKLLRLFEVYK